MPCLRHSGQEVPERMNLTARWQVFDVTSGLMWQFYKGKWWSTVKIRIRKNACLKIGIPRPQTNGFPKFGDIRVPNFEKPLDPNGNWIGLARQNNYIDKVYCQTSGWGDHDFPPPKKIKSSSCKSRYPLWLYGHIVWVQFHDARHMQTHAITPKRLQVYTFPYFNL